MTFSLEHFDLHFSPLLVTAGEKLYDKGAVKHAGEVEKHLWAYQVKGRKIYEIELLITPGKVSSYSCECENFVSDGECEHVVASLFHLRITKTEKVKKDYKTVRNVPKKLSIPNILSQIDADDLKNFVRNYSKRNKKFSTALKATFARKVEIENNEEKYESILNGIVKPATEVNHKISFQSLKQFIAISSQFDAQFEDSVSLKQYTEAFYIIKSLLNKVSYVNHWTASENEEILGLARHFHKQFRLLMELEIAPSLLQEMTTYGLELAGRSYYHITHPEHNLMLTLLEPPELEARKNELVQILEMKLNSSFMHDGELEKIWIIRQYFVEKNINLKSESTPVLSSQSVYRIVERLLEFKAFIGLRNFLELFRVNGQIKDVFLAKSYLEVLIGSGEKEETIAFAEHSLMLFKDIHFYDEVKSNYPEVAESFFKEISAKIKDKRTYEFQKLYLDILSSDGDIDNLVTSLLLSRYALRHIYDRAAFIKERSERLPDVLISLSDVYLSEYLGNESSREMKKLLQFLRKNDWESDLYKLQKHLLKGYEDRSSLKAEIQDF